MEQDHTAALAEFLAVDHELQEHLAAAALRWFRQSGLMRVSLTHEQVLVIREMYASGKFSQDAIAAQFGVKRAAISHIVNGKRHKNVASAAQQPLEAQDSSTRGD